jgi:hypothetical protein
MPPPLETEGAILRRNLSSDVMETGNAREWTAIRFPFLHVTVAVGGTYNDHVITRPGGRPLGLLQ